MISFITPEGIEADLLSRGDASLQVDCDLFNKTHFGNALPPITVSAASRLASPTGKPIQALTLKTDEVPELRGLRTPWLILIHEKYCELPFAAQLLLHEMTHVFLPDEKPYHSEKFWATLREKWLIDFNLVLGAGLNGDQTPSGLTKQVLEGASVLHRFTL